MNTLSGKTIGWLIRIARDVSKQHIQDLLLESEVCANAPDWSQSRHHALTKALFAARARAEDGEVGAHKSLLAFTSGLVPYCVTGWKVHEEDEEQWRRLKESLRSDGYELFIGESERSEGPDYFGRILPYDAGPAPLHHETTVLQEELDRRGYVVAAQHYATAIRHLTNQVHTSANAELRSALESLLVRLAIDHTGYQDTERANQANGALKTLWVIGNQTQPPLAPGKPLPERDGGRMMAGIWDILHPGGSHPGPSNAREARLRMQLVTALSLFLLAHFPHKD